MNATSPVLRSAAALAGFAAPFAFGAVAWATGSTVDLDPAAPVGDCGWVDPAAVADLPVTDATSELSQLTTLSAAFSATDLSSQLSGDGPFTVFAPVNDAFNEIPENVWDSIIADPELLSYILGYHVVVGEALSPEDLVAAGTVDTIGGTLSITAEGDTISVNGGEATVSCAGIQTGNATIYVIDRVLQPVSSEVVTGSECGSVPPGSSVPGGSVPAMTPDSSVPPMTPGSSVPGGSVPPGSSVPC